MALRNSSRLILAVAVASATYVANSSYSRSRSKKREVNLPVLADEVPSRETMLSALRGSSAANPYDVLVIGGGATGTGVALDAVTRGLKVALVEREDFGSGTSSRSTKLVHGAGHVSRTRQQCHVSNQSRSRSRQCMVLTRSKTSGMEQQPGETTEAYEARMLNMVAEFKQRAAAATSARKKEDEEAEEQRRLAEQQQQVDAEAARKTAHERRRLHRDKLLECEGDIEVIADEWAVAAEEEGAPSVCLATTIEHVSDLVATCAAQQEDILCVDTLVRKQIRIIDELLDRRTAEIGLCFLRAAATTESSPTGLSSDPGVVRLLDEFTDIFESLSGVVPDRPISHEIILEAGAVPPKGCIYRMSEEELEKNKDLHLCIDYRKLNAQTVKNAGPLPRIDDLLERLGGAKFFSKLDLKSGYHQILIRPQDCYKSTFKMRYGHFEWIVMPFGLTNAPTTFQATMTNEFRGMLDRFVLVYLDDILVYRRTLEDDLEHLRRVLETLSRAKYKTNRDKCEFVRQELEYLGHFVTLEGISPLSDKIQAMQEWPEPKTATNVGSFLGLAGYYQRFIKGYLKIAAPLSKLQCEDRPFDFDDNARTSFLALKAALLSAEVLRIYDLLLPTRATTDASAYGIGAVLEQHDGVDLHPIEYFSKKVLVVHSIDDTRKKELLAFGSAMDITGPFPKHKTGVDGILMVVDRLTKFAMFLPCRYHAKAPELAEFFYAGWIRNKGYPKEIGCDHDTRFMSDFWLALIKRWGSSLKPSSARHPQTDGQTERVHQTAQILLRTLIRPDQKDWVERLPELELAYNSCIHPAIRMSPFEFEHGSPVTSSLDTIIPRTAESDDHLLFLRLMQELLVKARDQMAKTQQRMSQQANRHPDPFRAGDLVWVSVAEFSLEQDISRKLLLKWMGPWPIIAPAGDAPEGPSFTIQVPAHLPVYPVFHCSKLALYTPAEHDDFPRRRSQDPPSMDGFQEVGGIISQRRYGNRPTEYLVHFAYCSHKADRWLTRAELQATAPDVLAHYERKMQGKPVSSAPRLKLYDLVAGPKLLFMSRFLWAREALDQFPQLAKTSPDGRSLKGAVVYFDGQMDDARLNVALACTAALVGATVANHTEVKTLHKDVVTQKIVGARVQDKLSGKEFYVHAKVVVNSTGPFCDSVRQMADKEAKGMIRASSGVHIILPDYYSPKSMGLIVPKTKDGRVLFMLPWLGKTLAGTTDADTKLTMRPEPAEEEINFILNGITDFLAVKVRREDVMSAWSGIRPLVTDPSASDTASASRDHVVVVDDNGLVTIVGGKWTTYRSMAEDAVDAAVKAAGLAPHNQSVTDRLRLVGAEGYDPGLVTVLTQQYRRMKISHGGKIIPGAFDSEVAHHLVRSYGGRAESVAFIAQVENLGKRLAHGYPVLEAEVAYCTRNEFCESAIDFIARRSRLAFLDTAAALQALPRVVDILAAEKKWDKRRKKTELDDAKAFLKTFGSSKNAFFIDGKHIKPEMKP
ncbi:hypothetical protein CBR_g49884 [Chara braunii]|uniref:Glycerol-3-phosphate dehydrogenase n=1 Tax=Chara braunii TaxID=69332 RepID=A0A388JP72_CHABU|nr:hypothetical protein CBR_g49884 [Chara braunii]|eukprot:GBG59619.1 hypothetical protein CBR_g49884 [Chara braunii]